MAAKRSWARLQATLTGPDLLSQLQQAFATLPEFEWAVQDMTSKLSEASDRQGMVALMQGQQAQIQQLASGSRQQQAPAARMAAAWTGAAGTAPQLGSVRAAADAAMAGQPGCAFWSGKQGSCYHADCPEAASHIPGQPSAKYAAKAAVYAAAGYQRDENGNFRRGAVKRAAPDAPGFPAPSYGPPRPPAPGA
jgi:hypothetical protein